MKLTFPLRDGFWVLFDFSSLLILLGFESEYSISRFGFCLKPVKKPGRGFFSQQESRLPARWSAFHSGARELRGEPSPELVELMWFSSIAKGETFDSLTSSLGLYTFWYLWAWTL